MSALTRSQNVRAIHHTDNTLPLTYGQTGMLGGNLNGITDWGRALYFSDAIQSSRGFCTPSNSFDPVKTDANGWPIEASVNVLTATLAQWAGQCPPGVYLMKYDSTPSDNVIFGNYGTSSDTYTIENTGSKLNTNGDITYFSTINIKAPAIIVLTFSGPVRNVKCARPGYTLDSTERYFPPMMKYISRFGCLRFMELLMTNRGSLEVPADGTWANRTTLKTIGNPRGGMCFEDVIAISNEAKAIPGNIVDSIWFNVVCTADDNYIRQACLMLKNTLDPNLKIYFELGNELWNSGGGFGGGNSYFNNLSAKDSTLSYDGNQAALTVQQRAYAKRVRETALIVESVFGPGSLNNRVMMILGCQSYDCLDKLEYLEYTFTDRPPGAYIYAVTGAPYYGLGDKTMNGLTTLQVINELRNMHTSAGDQPLPVIMPLITKGKVIAASYGIKLFGYEGGPGWDKATTLENMTTAYATNYSPEMRTLVRDATIEQFNRGMDNFNFFTIGPGAYSININGNWSGNEYIDKVDPKLQGVLDVMSMNVSSPADIISDSKITKFGTSVIDVLYKAKLSKNKARTNSSWYGPYGSQFSLFYNFALNEDSWIDWGVYVESAGNYAVSVATFLNTNSPTDPQAINYTVLIDDKLVGTIPVQSAIYPWHPNFLAMVATRADNTFYPLRTLIKDPSNATQLFICTSAGTTGIGAPAGYATAIKGTATIFVDGTATFQRTDTIYTGSDTLNLHTPPVTMALPQGWHKLRLNIQTVSLIGISLKSLSFTKV